MSIFLAVARICSASVTAPASDRMNYVNAENDTDKIPPRPPATTSAAIAISEHGGQQLPGPASAFVKDHGPSGHGHVPIPDDDVPDFMSDEFLVECSKNDVRPGLLTKHSDKRRHDLMRKQEMANEISKVKNKPMYQVEAENREKCLSTQIGSDNKGFQLLQKMGYKPGTSIGRKQDNESALKEPIPIVLKRNRLGLGEKTKAEKKKQKMDDWKEHLEQLSDPTEFRSRILANKAHQQIEADLRNAQSCCQTLDLQNSKVEPIEPYFWPKIPKPPADDDDTEEQEEDLEDPEEVEEISAQDKLKHLVEYLRDEYIYCIWCGAKYEDMDDYLENCPGLTRDDH